MCGIIYYYTQVAMVWACAAKRRQ